MMLPIGSLVFKWIFSVAVLGFWFLISFYNWIEYCPPLLRDPFASIAEEYDYIVVGAGSAGSVVALRLAEDANKTVLLIEAGPMGGRLLDVPAFLPLFQTSPLDYAYETVTQEYAMLGLKNHICKWPRGKLVGGTGRFNNMIYARGHPNDFAEWYANATDFDYDRDILHYFKKSENFIASNFDPKYHSKNGPLNVQDSIFVTDLSDNMLEAARYFGIPVRDLNGEKSTGFMKTHVNMLNGARYSTGHYLLDNKPKNLELLTMTQVEEILFKSNFEARAVRAVKFGVTKKIRAKEAVVLSAGTVDTAKLLMLSGIGPKSDLEKLGIQVKADLAVGENLHDHVSTGIDLFKVKSETLDLLDVTAPFHYLVKGKGAWTTAQCDALGAMHTDCFRSKDFDVCSDKKKSPPDLQIMALPMGFISDNGAFLRHIIGIKDNIWDEYTSNLIGNQTITLLPIVTKPKSRGFIKLRDGNPESKPIIDPKYLSDKEDVDVLIRGLEILREFIEAPSMRKMGAELYTKKLPGCEQFQFDSRSYWECYVRHLTLTIYHPVGTAKMGESSNPSTVVGFDFKVHGINKLFVADASVIPTIPSANTNAATVMIAEKAADSIKHITFLNSGFSKLKDIFFHSIIPHTKHFCTNIFHIL
ncbi:PREDICTED: glucose dehydrogenase [FAD, quinone]-like [Nicrophorus vespilloides]|uniref:Glucose dehydrogenase [FAD, quinone]-like n=1 Tax=Nicrophorus vespilloides TaxID=110193 RepID=A0ABM1NJA9_NICVS|nr:PREDICTED: glucose dehydrogenase [FAD, quinone]-like [Nicrophorus vespilloides]XP_017786909.1 PREDICTED: glucose dehydrogenase [FAD, quinone]-like [Nicrophorus vespilloides]